MKQKPTIIFDSLGPSGNIFQILTLVHEKMKQYPREIADSYFDCHTRVIESHSYEEALKIIREYVNLIDTRGRK